MTSQSRPPTVVPALAACVVPIRNVGDEAACAVAARTYAQRAGLSRRAEWEVGITASELAKNALKFAGSGTMTLSFDGTELFLTVADSGPGLPSAAVTDGWSEGALLSADRPRHRGQGLGVGLGAVYRMMDRVEIESAPGRGTRVVACKRRVPTSR